MHKTIDELLQTEFIKNIGGRTILSFSGVVSQDSIVGLGEALRSELHFAHPLNVVNKVFAIYVEMAQNILHYSVERFETNGKSIGIGSVVIIVTENAYHIVTINKVTADQRIILEKRCSTINKLTDNELKDFYLRKRRKIMESESAGAGLGLIDMVRRAGSPIEYDFEKLNDNHSFFYVSSKILIEK
ncbi:MAG: SiaB family protein kinase [Bacteroidota bacterium]